MDDAGVRERFGVPPGSIPDYLALVGDAADGIPGVPRWGARSASVVLARYGTLDAIPADVALWDVAVRGAAALGRELSNHLDDARLYKKLATLRLDVPLSESVDDLEWQGVPRDLFTKFCEQVGERSLPSRVVRWRD